MNVKDWAVMHSPPGIRFWLLLAIGMILGAPFAVMAEQVGTTPEGNVIYVFKCPGNPFPANHWEVNWPNHLGDHPT